MKYFPFKIFLLCILLPPVLYIYTMQAFETYLGRTFRDEVEQIYIGDTKPLFDGSIDLQTAITRNIDMYLNSKMSIRWGGFTVYALVTTADGTILYPSSLAGFDPEKKQGAQHDPLVTARKNYDLLTGGLSVRVEIARENDTRLAFMVMSAYLLLSVLVFYRSYRIGARRMAQHDFRKDRTIQSLEEREKQQTEQLKSLDEERELLQGKFEMLKESLSTEKQRATLNEDAMFAEIVALEEKLDNHSTVLERQKEKIADLKDSLAKYEKKVDGKQKIRQSDQFQKRFKTLYKNVDVEKRALSGLLDLPEDMKLKAEEVIHQLNENPEVVTVKRKVFCRKSDQTVLEVIFSYRGRLYFQQLSENKVRVVVIGTKNTQLKDLEYLDSL